MPEEPQVRVWELRNGSSKLPVQGAAGTSGAASWCEALFSVKWWEALFSVKATWPALRAKSTIDRARCENGAKHSSRSLPLTRPFGQYSTFTAPGEKMDLETWRKAPFRAHPGNLTKTF